MTICIAAICKDRKGNDAGAVVLISDRMVTFGNFLEFEHEIPKVTFTQPQIGVLIAGDALRGSKVLNGVNQQPSNTTVEQTANALASAYSACRDAQIEVELFRPRGITKSGFYAGEFSGISQQAQLFFSLDNAVQTFNFNVEMLVAGLDGRGAHIFSVGNPGGSFTDYHQIGFHAIGSGGIHALQSLIGFSQSRLKPLDETLIAVFIAKRRAESAPGVGNDTDLWIIEADRTVKLDDAQLGTLHELAEEYLGPYRLEVFEKVRSLYEDSPQLHPDSSTGSDV